MDKIWSIWGDSWTQYKRFCKIEGSETAILICRPFWNNFCFPLSKLARRHFIFAVMLFSSISVHSFKQTAPQNLFEGYVISMQIYAHVIISQKCAYPGKLVHTSGHITVYAKFLCGRVILHRFWWNSTKTTPKFDESAAILFLCKWESTNLNIREMGQGVTNSKTFKCWM